MHGFFAVSREIQDVAPVSQGFHKCSQLSFSITRATLPPHVLH